MYKIQNNNNNEMIKKYKNELIKKYINRGKGTNNIGQGMTTNINNEAVTIKNSY